jgi:hypothetical protein
MTKAKKTLIIANVLQVFSWPAGFLLASIASEGVDPAGRGYAEFFALGFVVLATYISVSIVLIRTGYKNWKQLGGWYKCLAITPAVVPAGLLLLILSIIMS